MLNFFTLSVSQLVSLNGNGKNDKLLIKGLENYPNNKIDIFNGWESLVYSKNKYINDWDGKANVADAQGSDILPAGTYYVIVEFGDANVKPYHWYLQLKY